MTLQELREKADARLVQFWAILTAKQEQYLKNNGRYWQGLVTPSAIPVDGAGTALSVAMKPSYQKEDWSYLELPINTKIPFQIEVTQYITPNKKKGFQATIFVSFEGKIYSRSKGVGVEASERDYSWQEIINE